MFWKPTQFQMGVVEGPSEPEAVIVKLQSMRLCTCAVAVVAMMARIIDKVSFIRCRSFVLVRSCFASNVVSLDRSLACYRLCRWHSNLGCSPRGATMRCVLHTAVRLYPYCTGKDMNQGSSRCFA
jgi:hypothetical protein